MVEQRIKEYLDEQGITQVWLSRKTGLDINKLNAALNGKRRITLEEYEGICWALDVPADKFLEARKPAWA